LEQIDLKAQVRKTTGKGLARALRREGRIPAVLYGPKTDSMMLSIDFKEFEQIVKKANVGSVLLNLQIQNGERFSFVEFTDSKRRNLNPAGHDQGIANQPGERRISSHRFL
jgi:ribosomal protein L25 (general stress protein Ctc)